MLKINGEQVFSCLTGSVMIGQTTGGYTLNYSVDGVNFTAMKKGDTTISVPANEDLILPNVPVGCMFKLVGNTDTAVNVRN